MRAGALLAFSWRLSSAQGGRLLDLFSLFRSIRLRNLSVKAMDGVMSPRDSARLIAETSKDVSVNIDGVNRVAQLIVDLVKRKDFSVKMWKEHELNPKTMDKDAVDWVFLTATINFSFWSAEDEQFMVRYQGKEHTGYWSMCAAINRALDEGIQITDPKTYANMSRDEFMKVFRSDSEHDIPLADKRLEVLREAGKVLVQKYNGSFVNCIKECGKSAQALLQLVVKEFPSYRDTANYNGKQVSFYKRVQILIGDIWGACEGKGLGEFTDIDTVTMFADYRIPQALVYFGALKYTDTLTETLKKDTMMSSGDRQEMEIRGCSIWATELVRDRVQALLASDPQLKDTEVNAILIDHYLWDYRRDHVDDMGDIPFHKIRCIYY